LAPEKGTNILLATPLGTISYRPIEIGPQWPVQRIALKFPPVISSKPTWETLPTEEQLLFEERQEQLIQEAKAKFLADFKVDRNNKVVRQQAASLRPTTNTPNVSSTNELQSLKDYIDEHQ
jgi:hypothetical protein